VESREIFRTRDLYFLVVSPRSWIVNIVLLKIPLRCFYHTVFLVYMLLCFYFMDVISPIYGFLRR
jgi:hypothetical protein